MSDRSNENVPRGDHVPGGPNDTSSAEMNQQAEPGRDSVPRRGHGAHGKGDGREVHDDAPAPTPPAAKGSDRGGDSGWDGGRAGGSVIDKR